MKYLMQVIKILTNIQQKLQNSNEKNNQPPLYPFLCSFLLYPIAKEGTHAANQLICY